jgi:TonB family protein
MPITEIPPVRQLERTGEELHDVPVLLIQLQDDLARSRMREAFWISVVVHLIVIIAIALSPKYLPSSWTRVVALTPSQVMKDKQLTYLDLPRDEQQVKTAPKTDILSDKNRIATSRNPVLDRKTLQELIDARRRGAPGQPTPSQPAQPSPQVAPGQQAATQQGQPSQGSQGRGAVAPTPNSQMARVEPPPSGGPNPFAAAMSPGSAIQQAARAAASGGGAISRYGSGGDYGLGSQSKSSVHGNLDVLSDTMGVDFGPYLQRVLHDVRTNWYTLIPEVARAPMMRKGKVAIEFAITKDGHVAGMKLTGPSGDVSLDRAAWGGITNSNPFPPLPSEFRGQYLALRFHFFYNPDKNDLD